MISATRLRYISSKDIDVLIEAVSALKFKIEIKGSPVFQAGRWYLFFTLPDVGQLTFQSMDL